MALTTCILLLATINKSSSQTVDSGQVEDPRLDGTKSDVVKVRIFLLGTCETGDVIRQLCNKVVNFRSKRFYQEIMYSVCALYFIIVT